MPFWLGALLVLASGWPIFANVSTALKRQVTSHTLMTLGVIAAPGRRRVGLRRWSSFMRVGDYAEKFTAEGARRAVKEHRWRPRWHLRADGEVEIAIGDVNIGDVVVVRPGAR